MTFIIDGTNGATFPDSSTQAFSSKVLQVVNATYSTQVDTTSGSYVDTGLTATITPKFSTSKILVLITQPLANTGTSGYGNIQLLRGATGLGVFGINQAYSAGGVNSPNTFAFNYSDSPATTSATTYKTQFSRSSGGGTMTVQQNSSISTITLMEIAQ